MEASVRTMLQKIYAHQIEGVMFHTLSSNMYAMLGKFETMVMTHDKQAVSELGCHLRFTDHMNSKYREMITAGTTSKPKLLEKEVIERPSSKLERDNLHKKLLEAWLEWEETTVELYESAIKVMPECTLLKVLYKRADKEVSKITRILDKIE